MSRQITSLQYFFSLPLNLILSTTSNLSHLLNFHMLKLSQSCFSQLVHNTGHSQLDSDILIPSLNTPDAPHTHLKILTFTTYIFCIQESLTDQHFIPHNKVSLTIILQSIPLSLCGILLSYYDKNQSLLRSNLYVSIFLSHFNLI